MLRFWFDRGAAGVRIDSAALAMKHPDLPEVDPAYGPGGHPFEDRDELHDLYREWRSLADTYDPPRVLIGEIWLPDNERSPCTFGPTSCTPRSTSTSSPARGRPGRCAAASSPPWRPTHPSVPRRPGCSPTTTSPASFTRYGREETSFSFGAKRMAIPTDLDPRSASRPCRRAAGDGPPGELLPVPRRRARSAGGRGPPRRAASRTRCTSSPVAWTPGATAVACRCRGRARVPPFGFSPGAPGRHPGCRSPPIGRSSPATAQHGQRGSTLELYRQALAPRRILPRRGAGLTCTGWPLRRTCWRSAGRRGVRRQPAVPRLSGCRGPAGRSSPAPSRSTAASRRPRRGLDPRGRTRTPRQNPNKEHPAMNTTATAATPRTDDGGGPGRRPRRGGLRIRRR